MKVLLTGGSGFLGSHVAEQLHARGVEVRALVRPSSDVRFLRSLPNVELTTTPIDDVDGLVQTLRGVDGVIHSAGLVKAKNSAEFHHANVAATIALLEATKRHGGIRRFVQVSSLAVMGPSPDGRPLPKGTPLNPVTHYGRSKLAAERAVLSVAESVPATIIRPPAIYGPRDKEILAFFQAVKWGVLPLMGSSTRGVSLIFAADCAAACIAALEADVPSGSTYCVDDGHTLNFGQLVSQIEAALGKRAWLRFPVPRLAMTTAALGNEFLGKVMDRAVMLTRDKCNELYAPHWVCDSVDAQRDLRWVPAVPFEQGARITADWYRAQGWL